jgi:chromosome partitioning protein
MVDMDPQAERLTISPASVELARLESELLTEVGREWFLKTALMKTDELREQTIVLIDCPPSLGVLSVNALVASDQLIVVVQPGGFELQALLRLHWTVQAIQQRANADLRMLGTLLSLLKFFRRTIKEQQQSSLGGQVSSGVMPESVVANLMKSPRQDVDKETAQELDTGETHGPPPFGPTIFVAERDVRRVDGQNP